MSSKSFEQDGQAIQPLRLKPKDAEFLQESWKLFLNRAGGLEPAGQEFYRLLFEKEPELKKLFKVPEMSQQAAFMRAMTRYVSLLAQPEQLRTAIEMLAFMHVNLDISETGIFAFSESLLECVEDQVTDWDPTDVERVMVLLTDLTGYIGKVIAAAKESSSEVQTLLRSSWLQAQERNMQPTKTKEAETDHLDFVPDDSFTDSFDKSGEKQNLPGLSTEKTPKKAMAADDTPKTNGGSTLPTSFQEMFQINAAVMGYSRSSSTWMPVVLDSVERIVLHVNSGGRIKEETMLLALRLNLFPPGAVSLSEFKSCLLAALRSTLPQVWTPKHEEAWTWLWDNVVRSVNQYTERTKPYEHALSQAYGSFSAGKFRKIQKEFFTAFFEIAPVGQNYFKQSLTRLLFIADKVLIFSLEILRQPKKMVSEMSALGLKHVGFGIPTDLFTPFITACIKVFRKFCPKDQASEAFEWALILVGVVLVRAIQEGSTVVMTAINANNEKALQKALAAAPRGERATWLLHIQVGDQFISPFVWALENGSENICRAMLKDLLIIRADRAKYYYGAEELFQRHPDIVKRLTDRTSALLRTLLDGLVWRSYRTESNGTKRRVNYFVKYMLQDEKGKFSSAIKWISAAGDPSIVSHPVVDVNIELLWAGVVRRQFIVSRMWNIVNLLIFIFGQEIMPATIRFYGGSTQLYSLTFFFRMFSYIVGMGRLLMLQLHRVWIWSRDTMRRIIADIDTDGNGEIDWEEMKEALSRFKDTVKGEIRKALKVLRNDEDVEEMDTSKKDLANQEKNTYNRISFTVMLMLVLMMFLEPMLRCANSPDWPTDQCPEATAEIFYWYSVCGMIAMIVHWLLLIDMTIFSTQLSAFLLVVGHVLGEVKQFLTALTFLLLLFGSTISILCDRQCGDDGGNFNDMWNAIISLFSITVGLYQGDFREIQGDPMLLTMIYLFLLVSVVLLLNLLIAQLNQTYEYINKDVLGFARLNRASLVVDAMASCPKAKWKSFITELRLDEKREFDEGDLGLAGCIQSHEPSGLTRQNEEPIKRYGGTTASEAPWPEERQKRTNDGAEDNPDVRLAHIEYLLEKALRRKGLEVGTGGQHSSSAGHSSRSMLSSGGTASSAGQSSQPSSHHSSDEEMSP